MWLGEVLDQVVFLKSWPGLIAAGTPHFGFVSNKIAALRHPYLQANCL